MTPERKALELVALFDESLNHLTGGTNGIEKYIRERAISCALICVDEILGLFPDSPLRTLLGLSYEMTTEVKGYWEQVKQEIKKL